MPRPKTGGRKKGTANKPTKDLIEQIQGKFKGYHPVLAMAEIANKDNAHGMKTPLQEAKAILTELNAEDKLAGKQKVLAQQIKRLRAEAVSSVDLRFQAHKEVAQYVAPKRKAIEVTGELGLHERALQQLEEGE